MRFPILFISIVLTVASCNKESPFKGDTKKLAEVALNKKIDTLLKSAESMADDNDKARVYGEASELLLLKGDNQKAISIARKGERANPTQKICLTSIGEYYITQNRFREAEMILSDVLGRDPKYARAQYLYGNAQYSMGKIKQAKAAFESALAIGSQDVRVHNNLAALYSAEKKDKQALALLQQAIKIRPGLALTYKNAGLSAEKLKMKKEAIEFYAEYLKLSPYADDTEVVRKWIKKLS